MLRFVAALTFPAVLLVATPSWATTEEDANNFMQLHQVEITFHQAGTTKNLDLMLSLFADDATLTAGEKHIAGKIRSEPIGKPQGRSNPKTSGLPIPPRSASGTP